MTTAFSAIIENLLSWAYSESDDFGVKGVSNSGKKYRFPLSNGNGANQAEWVYRSKRTLTASTTTDDLDLFAVLTDVLNLDVRAATIRAISVVNLAEDSGEKLLVGGAGAGGNAWGAPFNNDQDAEVVVGPNSPFLHCDLVDGFVVTPSTGDVLRILHDGVGDIEYEIILIGTSEA